MHAALATVGPSWLRRKIYVAERLGLETFVRLLVGVGGTPVNRSGAEPAASIALDLRIC